MPAGGAMMKLDTAQDGRELQWAASCLRRACGFLVPSTQASSAALVGADGAATEVSSSSKSVTKKAPPKPLGRGIDVCNGDVSLRAIYAARATALRELMEDDSNSDTDAEKLSQVFQDGVVLILLVHAITCARTVEDDGSAQALGPLTRPPPNRVRFNRNARMLPMRTDNIGIALRLMQDELRIRSVGAASPVDIAKGGSEGLMSLRGVLFALRNYGDSAQSGGAVVFGTLTAAMRVEFEQSRREIEVNMATGSPAVSPRGTGEAGASPAAGKMKKEKKRPALPEASSPTAEGKEEETAPSPASDPPAAAAAAEHRRPRSASKPVEVPAAADGNDDGEAAKRTPKAKKPPSIARAERPPAFAVSSPNGTEIPHEKPALDSASPGSVSSAASDTREDPDPSSPASANSGEPGRTPPLPRDTLRLSLDRPRSPKDKKSKSSSSPQSSPRRKRFSLRRKGDKKAALQSGDGEQEGGRRARTLRGDGKALRHRRSKSDLFAESPIPDKKAVEEAGLLGSLDLDDSTQARGRARSVGEPSPKLANRGRSEGGDPPAVAPTPEMITGLLEMLTGGDGSTFGAETPKTGLRAHARLRQGDTSVLKGSISTSLDNYNVASPVSMLETDVTAKAASTLARAEDLRGKQNNFVKDIMFARRNKLAAAGDTGKRWLLLNELATTEESYMLQLTELVYVFRSPLSDSNKKICSKEDVDKIFSNVTTLLQFHTVISQDLRVALDSWLDEASLPHLDGPDVDLDELTAEEVVEADARLISALEENGGPHIGSIIASVAPFMKLAQEYIGNYDNSVAHVTLMMKKRKRFAAVVSEQVCTTQSVGECAGEAYLKNLLIVPIQRYMRYAMLLQDILKRTPEDHSDAAALKKAGESVDEVLEWLNKRRGEDEKRAKRRSRRSNRKSHKYHTHNMTSAVRSRIGGNDRIEVSEAANDDFDVTM